ncbi:MAG TPA: hypothetical protein VH083_09035 [Myxococcales bacterium]|nr:hypothetical protein [Myxococcales bacterium]
MHRLYAILLCAVSSGASAATAYAPFTFANSATGQSQGLWLADSAHPGNPPVQVSNQTLDGTTANIATFNDWTLDANRHATDIQPQLVVYGVGGHLFKVNLSPLTAVQQLGNGTYQELCSLTPLDQHPFAPGRAFVQAVVEPVGSPNTCAQNLGTQTWLIPANATAAAAPTLRPSFWSVLGAFTDPATGAFNKWIIWTGNEIDTDNATFTRASTLLVGPPAGPAPVLTFRLDGTAFIDSQVTAGTTVTDNWYRLTPATAALIASFPYANTAPCAFFSTSMLDAATGTFVIVAPDNLGYAAFTTPIGGGALTQIYSDHSGTVCGAIEGDSASAGFISLGESDVNTGLTTAIGINEAGPATQTKVVLAGGPNSSAFVHYTIGGHDWIDLSTFGPGGTTFSTIVADADGTLVQTYANSRISDDGWSGFPVSGAPSNIDRDVVYLFSPASTVNCTGGTLAAINPSTFVSTNIAGLPANACRPLAFGFGPINLGGLATATGGGSPIQIDPTAGQLYFPLGPQPGGSFLNPAILSGYPFF